MKRRLRGDGPVCFGLRRTMLDVSAETIREIHAQSSSDFDKYVGIGYSVSTEAMDRNGFHPVCVMGTQIKIVSIPEEEEEEEEVRPSKANRQHQQHQQQQVEGATATGSFSSEFPQLLWASFGKQSSALYQNWNRTFTNFPQKLYTYVLCTFLHSKAII